MSEAKFLKRRKLVSNICILATFLVLSYFCVDLYFNYLQYFLNPAKEDQEQGPVPATMIAEYYFVGVMYLLLTVMLVWLTCLITGILKGMGRLLQNERQRLIYLMIIFTFSYLGSSVYYIFSVATKLHCTSSKSCVRFGDLMLSCVFSLICDLIPLSVLYY